ncbi:Type IV pilus assembly PilZ [Desulfosarcina cetonica]|uniref:PilZ domain-containing protein n=1 Tax=Desulfosarcina cetonica TaxID=90730 RepID=UPI0006D296C6|nr:PilZ domain-containing protein [Desulfosarcina cetonica]VTR70045.1 Type IV pilus assembly PilZ [Desulfosarcina cetonica]
MDQIVFITSKNTATFRCPQCGKAKTADVSRYLGTDKNVTVNCTCGCGHRFRCRLEKRRHYRKPVHLPGKFVFAETGRPRDTGLLTVVDISSSGLKLKMSVSRDFPIGALLQVEFHLDDRNRTPMKKRVIVRNVSGSFVGVTFHPDDLDDPALGFYLMP